MDWEALALQAWQLHQKAWPRDTKGKSTRKPADPHTQQYDEEEYTLTQAAWYLLHPPSPPPPRDPDDLWTSAYDIWREHEWYRWSRKLGVQL